MAAVLALIALHVALAAAANCTTGFSVVAPEVAVPGKTTAVLVTLHGREGDDMLDPLNVTVRLEAQDVESGSKTLAAASQMITGYGIIPLKIPSSPATHCTLLTTVGCAGNDECTSRSHTVIRLLGPVRDVIVRPARHHYRPGETVTFWVLALDHDLRLVRQQPAHVTLSDPAGTNVALWEQLSMDEGVKKLSVIIAAGARSGTWRLSASCGGGSSVVDISVSTAAQPSTTSPPAAEQHYVELRFADSMRRRYKPGLPFVGRVEAMSTEKQVRVRVKLYDDTTDIYSQDIDMSSGEGGFIVPTVMADAPFINLQAELVAVEGKEIETHYVLAREKIRRWNSTSKCYLLVENLPTPLQAGSIARASVWSSCGCRQPLLAAVTSGGRAVHWAAVPAPANDSDLCRFSYKFPVTADMAPVSSLLVYYVTEAGEPVSDVANFHVKLLHKEVAIAIEERRWWYPRAALQLRVLAPPDSTMCLIGARSPPDAKFDARPNGAQAQPGPEFVSAGVSLFVGGGACGGGVLYRQRSPAEPPPAHLVPPAAHDRLWMWRCFNYTSQLSTDGVTISAPSEAGRWSLWALSLSSRGLRFSAPRTINVFRPIQLDFALPPALKVGETVEVDVKITNNINNCMDVTALLALSAGAAFASTGALYVTERLRLGPRGGTQLVVRVSVNTPGKKNITVEVTGYSADNCSVSYTSFNNETLVGSVIRSASVLVLPEGLHRSDTESAYFCANEHLAVSSRGSWEWQWVAAPRNRAGLVLELKAQGAAHVALSGSKEASDDMYRVVFERSRVWIAKGKHGYDVHLASAEQTEDDSECAPGRWCAWWLWWEGARLSVGRGAAPAQRRLLAWPLPGRMRIRYVGFSAMWGDKADFRIWNFNEEAGFSQVLELGLPHGVVPGSASGTLLISGGLHLPLYSTQADNEQWGEVWKDSQLSSATASLAPLLALEHIPHMIEDSERERILKKLPEQVQILLSFRKSDDSFSEHPGMSSHQSTIQILEILNKVQAYYPVDPNLLLSIKKWIQNRQDPDGSFSPLPADKEIDYYPIEINLNGTNKDEVNEYYYYEKDGNITKTNIEWEKKVEVTATTLTALLEVGIENQRDADVATKAQVFLEANLNNLTSPAALTATVLSLVLARSPVVPEALEILKNASTTEEGEFGWPAPKKNAADWLLEDSSRNIKSTSYEAVSMEQYVAAVRVLLTACSLGSLPIGEAAARFVYYRASTLRRHPALALAATSAAAQYAALARDRHRALTVSLATAGMELTDTLELRANTPPRPLQLPGLPTKVFVYATGAGCATVQGTISYSTYKPKLENALLNIQSAIIEEIRPERSSLEDLQGNLPTLIIKTCFKWKSKERSGILRLETSLFSGYELHTVNPVVLDGATFADLHYGSRGEAVWFIFANISSICPVCVTYEARSKFVISSLRPAFAKIYPSSRPDLAVETFFHARAGSPLLKGITDDDFITWFDKTELASLKSQASIDNVCECGRICSRDYEFRRKEIKHNDSLPSKSSTPETVTDSSKNDISTATANEISMNTGVSTLSSSLKYDTTQSTIVELIKPIVTPTVKTPAKKEVRPIISLPKSMDTKPQHHQNESNELTPIVLKSYLPVYPKLPKKMPSKQDDLGKKPLLRRKGTLKATYGDKADKYANVMSQKIKESKDTVGRSEKYSRAEKEAASQQSNEEVLVIPTNFSISNIVKKQEKEKIPITASKIQNNEKRENELGDASQYLIQTKDPMQLNYSYTKTDQNLTAVRHETKDVTVKPVPELSKANVSLLDTTTTPHTIVAITSSYVRSLYKTKRPKPVTQIKKPRISAQNQTKPVETNESSIDEANKTVLKNETNFKVAIASKSIKSINKEIHKVPTNPISETTKILIDNSKSIIAQEEKGKSEIVLKNRIWNLLKGSYTEPKVDDRMQVHKLNYLAQNATNS